jgi:pyruvate dehydrogenase E2 component (dihydrolipoamide acetyltransferase)
MPKMGYDMTEGSVAKWVRHEGDAVKRGEIIAEIETDKAVVEMEAEATGVLRKVLVQEGAKVPVGQAIAYIGTADEPNPAGPASVSAPKAPAPAPATVAALAPKGGEAAVGGDARVSPVARRIAGEQGIDVSQVAGTGPGGRVTKDDVLSYAKRQIATPEPPPPAPAAAPAAPAVASPLVKNGRIELSRMGQAIARRTKQAKQEIPHYYVSVQMDMTRALEFRKEINLALGEEGHISVNDLIVKACALALGKFPMFNSVFKDDHLDVSPHVNVGIAIALPEGLIVPAVLECERKSLVQIAKETKDLGQRVRAGRLRQDEATAGTFSVSNLGAYHVDNFAAIIVHPQSAVLAVGTIRPQPVVRDGAIVVRQMMDGTLSADHRVSNGTDAAKFINEVKRLLESPLLLVPERLL